PTGTRRSTARAAPSATPTPAPSAATPSASAAPALVGILRPSGVAWSIVACVRTNGQYPFLRVHFCYQAGRNALRVFRTLAWSLWISGSHHEQRRGQDQ